MTKASIVADGSIGGTVISVNGESINDKVQSVTFRHNGGGIPAVEIDLMLIEIGVVDAPARMIGPGGKEVRRIEYADGTVDEFPPE